MHEDDPWHQLDASLRQRSHNLRLKLTAVKSEILAKHSAAGRLRSGATLQALAEAFDIHLINFCQDAFAHIHSWYSVEGLDEPALRSTASDYLRQIVATLPEPDYVSYGGALQGSAADAIEKLVNDTRAKANVEIRNFEIGVGKLSAPGSQTYVVNAHAITGGVQQGTVGSTQSNIVEISVGDVNQALERLVTELAATGRGEVVQSIQADVETLRAQLSKPEPNRTILREAASSVKNVIEGALGGVISTAMTPQFAQALLTLSSLIS